MRTKEGPALRQVLLFAKGKIRRSGWPDFLEPVLAVYKAGDQKAHHIVAGGVDHCGRGIYQVADGHQDGEGNLNLLGEEDGADDVLTDVASAGHAGHAHRGEHRHSHHRRSMVQGISTPMAPGQGDFSTQEKQEPSMVHG